MYYHALQKDDRDRAQLHSRSGGKLEYADKSAADNGNGEFVRALGSRGGSGAPNRDAAGHEITHSSQMQADPMQTSAHGSQGGHRRDPHIYDSR